MQSGWQIWHKSTVHERLLSTDAVEKLVVKTVVVIKPIRMACSRVVELTGGWLHGTLSNIICGSTILVFETRIAQCKPGISCCITAHDGYKRLLAMWPVYSILKISNCLL